MQDLESRIRVSHVCAKRGEGKDCGLVFGWWGGELDGSVREDRMQQIIGYRVLGF